MTTKEYWEEYDRRVNLLEKEGLTRSDAQSIVDIEFIKEEKNHHEQNC